jgi:hypothetical protein
MGIILALLFPSIIFASTCYLRNGDVATSNYKPCNANAKGVTGSHSACCYTTNNDVCLSSGLCLFPGARNSVYNFSNFFADGCTDKNLEDSSCQTFCPPTKAVGQTLLNCGNGAFCCVDLGGDTNATACCGGHTFSLPNGVGVPINQTTATSAASGSTENSSIAVAIGSTLGALLAISLSAIVFLVWKLRRLRTGLDGTTGLDETSVTWQSGTTAQKGGGKGVVEADAVESTFYELPAHRR